MCLHLTIFFHFEVYMIENVYLRRGKLVFFHINYQEIVLSISCQSPGLKVTSGTHTPIVKGLRVKGYKVISNHNPVSEVSSILAYAVPFNKRISILINCLLTF